MEGCLENLMVNNKGVLKLLDLPNQPFPGSCRKYFFVVAQLLYNKKLAKVCPKKGENDTTSAVWPNYSN